MVYRSPQGRGTPSEAPPLTLFAVFSCIIPPLGKGGVVLTHRKPGKILKLTADARDDDMGQVAELIQSHAGDLRGRHVAMALVIRQEVEALDLHDPQTRVEMRGWRVFADDLEEAHEAGRPLEPLIEEGYRHVLALRTGALTAPTPDWDELVVLRSKADIKERST